MENTKKFFTVKLENTSMYSLDLDARLKIARDNKGRWAGCSERNGDTYVTLEAR